MDFSRDWCDRHVQPGGRLFDVKAAGGGPFLDGATGHRHPENPQDHDPAEGVRDMDAAELHGLKVVQLPCLKAKMKLP